MSAIEWTDVTWNPLRGCTRVSEGCRNCYAEKVAARFSFEERRGSINVETGEVEGGRRRGPYANVATRKGWNGQVELVESKLAEPLRWRKPRRVFVNSMSDLFHESVPDEWIDRVFAVMALAPQHTFQVLTKRPERMREYLRDLADLSCGLGELDLIRDAQRDVDGFDDLKSRRECERTLHNETGLANIARLWGGTPLPNVWLGVSVENQATAGARIPILLQTPAAVRFVSSEPLLGPVDLRRLLLHLGDGEFEPDVHHDALTGLSIEMDEYTSPALGWVIVGGESGPGARPCDAEWIRSIVRQCRDAGVPAFVKQLGSVTFEGDGRHTHVFGYGRDLPIVCDQGYPCPICERDPALWVAMDLKSRKGGDPAEWPEDLRVREFPKAVRP